MFTITIDKNHLAQKEKLYREWLVTNGIGGYACGSLCGTPWRKYHSLLNAALPAPFGRTSMLDFVKEEIIFESGKKFTFCNLKILNESESKVSPDYLVEYRLENGIPIWKYEFEGCVVEKSLFLIHRQNTACLSYKILSSPEPVQLKWRPFFHFRTSEQPINLHSPDESYTVRAKDFEYEIECPGFPILRIYNETEPSFTLDSRKLDNIFYEIENKRGYSSEGSLTSPGYFMVPFSQNKKTAFYISTESWMTIHTLKTNEARQIEKFRKRNLLKVADSAGKSSTTAKLVIAADQFLITPITRFQDMVRLQAAGEEVRSIIAGYPWFTDWGRDTMISLEGLTLCTGRHREAYAILHTFAYYIKNGLIPNMFPDGETQGIYNTADATLWFFHAINRYVEKTRDEDIIEFLLPKLREIIESHINGTLFGIKVDKDGLLIQGQEGYQLTWMDAKVGDWVVTPRRGKAVEINALWYNALKLYEIWSGIPLEISAKCYESFNEKFWNEKEKCLYDIVEGEQGNDPAIRPNQLFAISLQHPVLKAEYWKSVLDVVTKNLLTPIGLRTLAPSHPDYKAYYEGDLYARDAAYHQGTVWPWLLGPYIDVWLKVYPDDKKGAQQALQGLVDHLNNSSMGSIEEIFDAEEPFQTRGCFAQAWSVAECLRCLLKVGIT